MMKDILTQFSSAQNILLSLSTKRLSFVYLVTALNKALKERNITLKIYCKNLEIKNELQTLDPFIQDQFVDNIEKTTYSLVLKKGGEISEVIDNTSLEKDVSLIFESKDNNISLHDFEFKKDSQNFDMALLFGDFLDEQMESIESIKSIKSAHFISLKKQTTEKKPRNQYFINGSQIQFFIDLLECIEFNNKKEVYTLVIAAILIESNNLSNNKTTRLMELLTYATERGGIFSIAQNYLAQNNIQDISRLGNILSKTREIAKNVYYSEALSNPTKTTPNFIEDILYILKKIKGHKLIILNTYFQNKFTYHLITNHSRVDLNLLKDKFSGSGDKEYFKFSSKIDGLNIIKDILDTLSLEHSISIAQTSKPFSGIQKQIVSEVEQEVVIDINDPLKPAQNIPEPLTFFKGENKPKPQANSPLPTAI